ncbi:MAG: SMP-30/gluconolactonase/LRE family protein [Cyanobacteria bacterium]|nr:SMP-30/gluconolactonase/LRE family protein [Cyanobacteriota bacterium]
MIEQQSAAKAVNEIVDSAKVVRRSAALDAVIAPDVKIERVATGFAFTEGPMWHNGALWFSDLMGNKMYSLSAEGTLKLLLDHAGGRDSFPAGAYGGSNAMAADRDGTVLMMQHSARRIVRLDDKLNVTPFLTTYEGKQFNSPNDLAFAKDGALYFTDPPYGLFNPATPNADLDTDPRRQISFNGVYRYHNGKVAPVITDLRRPNGLAFSPDGRVLYVANSEGPSAYYRYDVKADGTIGSRQLFADVTKEPGGGVPDGLKVDSRGNLWASGQGGFRIYSSTGEVLGQIVLPEVAANLAWGGADGRTAYFTASTSIYRMAMKIPGSLPPYYRK